MNKRKKAVLAVGISLIFALGIFLLKLGITDAQECRIIRIHGGAAAQVSRIHIEPETSWIPKGTCVVWINWAKGTEVKVTFQEGKRCDDVTDAPMGFTMSVDNCYVTNFIPLGGTSSLRFNEAGTFEYIVEVSPDVKEKGKIIVQ